MKKLIIILLVLLLISLFTGCASYKIGNKSFSSSEEALSYHEKKLAENIEEIQPITENAKSYGKALIALPSSETIEKNYIRITGNASALSREQIEFLITSVSNNNDYMFKSIEKRQLFNKVTKMIDPDPATIDMKGNDFILYLDIDGWFLKGKYSNLTRKISIDSTLPIGVPRTLSFLESLEKQLKETLSKVKNN